MRTVRKKLRDYGLIPVLLFFIPLIIQAQGTSTLELLPEILPATPEAASFTKYGNYPVNLFTGIPDISIPLYEIKVGELEVPISISYHASGIKVNDYGSWVGLGWNLNAGGMITRKIMGKPDDQSGNYLSGNTVRLVSSINTSLGTDLNYLKSVYQGNYDTEPDIFSYNLPGKNGKFLFNQQDSFKPIIIPYDPIVISRTSDLFDITDERGVLYQCHGDEFSDFAGAGSEVSAISAWVLTKMISSNKQDSISFSYTSRYGEVSEDFTDLFVINDAPVYHTLHAPIDMGSSYTSTNEVTATEQKINEIDFRNGKIIFDASAADRLDGFSGQKSLTDIKVFSFDPAGDSFRLFRQVNFYQSYFLSTPDSSTRGLRLDSIGITDNSGTVIQKYRFTYNTQLLPRKDSRSRDYWGYYNGKDNHLSLIPEMTIPYINETGGTTVTVGSANRDPDSTYMQAGMLKRVYYPTGGYSEFTYETNQYIDDASNVFLAGGLRIKSITNYDGINPSPTIQTYKYGTDESGNGRANFILNNYFFETSQTNQYIDGCDPEWTRRTRTYCSNPSLDIEPYDGSPVVYSTVTEYNGDGTTNNGKAIYYFTDHPDAIDETFATNHPVITTFHMDRGQLLRKEVYLKTGTGSYQIVSKTENSFEAFPETEYENVGFVAFKTTITDGEDGSDLDLGVSDGECVNDSHNYIYANYDVRSDDNRLTQTVQTDYDQNDPAKYVQTWTHYYYDNFSNQQITRIYTVNSLGDTSKVIRKYPHDFSTTAPYDTMISLNNINKVVQEQKLDNNTQLTLQTNNYLDKGNGNYLPDNITYQVASYPVETRANFNSYDAEGNILEMQKTNDAKQSVIWDYQHQYPVAEVSNAAQNQIAYTSFEADGNGNWTISDTSRSLEGMTGNRSFILNASNSISYTFDSAGFNFILSYWSKNGQVSIGGVTVVKTTTGLTKNGWTYYEYIVTAGTGNTLTLTASSAQTIDELRLYPYTALMTTYTYSPLIGITSKCSQNNTITYYNYDTFNRLKAIRDEDGNIVKTIEYNYQTNTIP